jgi:hypothetical protein
VNAHPSSIPPASAAMSAEARVAAYDWQAAVKPEKRNVRNGSTATVTTPHVDVAFASEKRKSSLESLCQCHTMPALDLLGVILTS